MQPYVIKQGDYLALLAHVYDFDANTVWNDPANAELRKRRPDPNMLYPTDILYIPDQVNKKPVTHALTTGQTNTFVSDSPTIDVSIRFAGPNRASQAFTIAELASLTGLTTSSDGTASFKVPVSLRFFTVVFSNDGASFKCKMGHLDPIGTLSGVVQRLQNLGYLDPCGGDAVVTIEAARLALSALRYVQTGNRPPAKSGGASSEDDSEDPAEDDAPDSSEDDSDDAPDSSEDDSDDAPVDNAGLDDSGVLNDEMTKRLLTAHGS